MLVELSRREYMFAAYGGLMRHALTVYGHQTDRSKNDDPIGLDIKGAVAEYACAKLFGRFWSGPGELNGADVGVGGSALQVRSTVAIYRSAVSQLRLVLREDDDDDDIYVLMVGTKDCPMVWDMRGWIHGRDGKRPEFRDSPNERATAYFVPQTSLHDGIPPWLNVQESMRAQAE